MRRVKKNPNTEFDKLVINRAIRVEDLLRSIAKIMRKHIHAEPYTEVRCTQARLLSLATRIESIADGIKEDSHERREYKETESSDAGGAGKGDQSA